MFAEKYKCKKNTRWQFTVRLTTTLLENKGLKNFVQEKYSMINYVSQNRTLTLNKLNLEKTFYCKLFHFKNAKPTRYENTLLCNFVSQHIALENSQTGFEMECYCGLNKFS